MSCPPDFVNYLVVQISDTADFAHPLTQILPASAAVFPVNGSITTPKWVRAKWRRSTDPLEEGPWSNTLPLNYLAVTGSDTGSCCGDADRPSVPIIRSVLGWSEFIEVCLMGNQQGEGCEVGYNVDFSASGRSWIWVKNTSTDASVSIVDAALIIGEPRNPDCRGDAIVAAGFHPNDPFLSGSIADVSNYAPYIASPPVADILVPGGKIKYYGPAVPAPPGVVPPRPDYECLTTRCPEPTDAGYNKYFECISVSDVARTPSGFSLPGGSDYYVKVDAGICRAFGIYIGVLGRTVFPPFLGVPPSTGAFAYFVQYGTVYVKFSTGLAIYRPALVLAASLGGIRLVPATSSFDAQLDDFFVFISETSFANDLGATSWQDAVINNALPEGVALVMISRSTNLLVSNLSNIALDPEKTYYFRVGARRFTSFRQEEFLYSETLSEEATGKLGTALALNEALGGGTAEDISASIHWKEPVPTNDDLPTSASASVGDVHVVVTDQNGDVELRAYAQGSFQRVGGRRRFAFVFGVPGPPIVGDNMTFQLVAPCDGEFTDWNARIQTAATGSSTILDVHNNGTSLWSFLPSLRPTIASGQTVGTGTAFDVAAQFSQGDVLTFNIDQVGSTTPGLRVQLQLNAKER